MKICSNATWAENGTIIISNYINGNYWTNLADFVIDNNNNVYVIDSTGSRVLKFNLTNLSSYNVVAVTNLSSNYQPSNIFVDANGTIYTTESMVRSLNKRS